MEVNYKKDLTITLAKYTAYSGILLAVFFERKDNFIPSILVCSFLITIGSVRQYVLEGKLEGLRKYTFILDLLLVTMLGVMQYNSIFVIGYFIILLESAMVCSYQIGALIAVAAYLCFFGVYFSLNELALNKDTALYILYNSLFFILFYFICISAKRQLEQKDKLLDAIDRVEKSKLDLEAAYDSLLLGNKRLQEFTILEERNRVAREIHDTLAHTLTTIVVEIEAGMKLMGKAGCENSSAALAAKEELMKAQNQARVGLDEVRHSIKNLRSGVLNKEGFHGALALTLEQLKAHNNVEIKLELEDNIELSDEYEMTLFRIIQEAATNSFRHGRSSQLLIKLERVEEQLVLIISDDGVGCSEVKAGYGLLGIRERARKHGGRVDIDSSPGNGFQLSVTLPDLQQGLETT